MQVKRNRWETLSGICGHSAVPAPSRFLSCRPMPPRRQASPPVRKRAPPSGRPVPASAPAALAGGSAGRRTRKAGSLERLAPQPAVVVEEEAAGAPSTARAREPAAPSTVPTPRPPTAKAGTSHYARLWLPAVVLFSLVLLPLACSLAFTEEDGTLRAPGTAAPAPLTRVRGDVIHAARSLVARLQTVLAACVPFAPAAALAAAAALPRLFTLLRWQVHEAAQWCVGIFLMLAASILAAHSHGVLNAGGAARGAPPAAPLPLRLDALNEALQALPRSRYWATNAPSPEQTATLGRLHAWAQAWQETPVWAGGASRKLLLFANGGGAVANAAVDALARSLLPSSGGVLELHAATDCDGGGDCAARIERHLAATSARGERSLVVVRHVEACASDAMFDSILSTIERYLDETPQVQTTAYGDVVKALTGFVLFAPSLTQERCEAILASGADVSHELVRSGEVESLWPRARFSAAVNAAKRAFVNRLGSDLAIVCG